MAPRTQNQLDRRVRNARAMKQAIGEETAYKRRAISYLRYKDIPEIYRQLDSLRVDRAVHLTNAEYHQYPVDYEYIFNANAYEEELLRMLDQDQRQLRFLIEN